MVASILVGGRALKAKVDLKLVRNVTVVRVLSFVIQGIIFAVFAATGYSLGALKFK